MNSLPKTVTGQHRDCDLNLGPSMPESSTLTTRIVSIDEDITDRSWGLFWPHVKTTKLLDMSNQTINLLHIWQHSTPQTK